MPELSRSRLQMNHRGIVIHAGRRISGLVKMNVGNIAVVRCPKVLVVFVSVVERFVVVVKRLFWKLLLFVKYAHVVVKHIEVRTIFAVGEQFVELFGKRSRVLLSVFEIRGQLRMRLNHVHAGRLALHVNHLLKIHFGAVVSTRFLV